MKDVILRGVLLQNADNVMIIGNIHDRLDRERRNNNSRQEEQNEALHCAERQ